jgi:predicted transcriptional regulator
VAKVTKRENLVAIATFLREAGEVELAEFAEKEVGLIDKRASKPRALTADQKANVELKETIVDILVDVDEGASATDVANGLGVSVQKASQLLRQLVAEGRVTRTEGKGKAKTLFSV